MLCLDLVIKSKIDSYKIKYLKSRKLRCLTLLVPFLFHKVFKMDNGIDLQLNPKVSTSWSMEDVLIIPSDVASSMHMISDKLSCSSDNISAYFLK